MSEREAKAPAIAARMRRTGLSEIYVDGKPETGKPNVGTPQGLLCLQGHITADQFLAAEWYMHRRNEYLQAIKAPGAQWEALTTKGEENEGAHDAWCNQAVNTWADIRHCLHMATLEVRSPIMSAFEHVLERGGEGLSHMFGDLRVGLNAVHRTFMLARKRAA